MAVRSLPKAFANNVRSSGMPTAAGEPRWLANHVLWPGLVFAAAVAVLGPLHGDLWIADRLYAIEGHGWSLSHDFVTDQLIHIGGRRISALAWTGVVLAWLASWRVPTLREWRRPLLYLWLSVLLSTALVSAIKRESGLDCPWDLLRYGGDRAYFGWFSARPAWMPHASCFPAGHASAGYAWVALYFVFLAVRPVWKWRGLATGLIVGAIFGIAQQLRGAHFFSHDLWTLMICWSSALLLYAVVLAPRRAAIAAVVDNASGASAKPMTGSPAAGGAQ